MQVNAPFEMRMTKKTYYVLDERISTNRVTINHAIIEMTKPIIAHFIPAFALSTPELSPVIPDASCILTE